MGENDVLKATLGDRGRLVIPAEVREKLGLETGSVLVFRMQDDAVEVISREALMARVRADWAKVPGDPIAELIADRRREALTDIVEALEDGWRPSSDEVNGFRETFGQPWLDVEERFEVSSDDADVAA